jgi:methionyl-tRNA formyltransferase
MRIAFAGTPDFAARALEAILQAGLPVGLVLSQPDRPAGRGQRLQASAVKQLAMQHHIPVFTPTSLRPERGGEACMQALEQLRRYAPDVLVVAAYGLLLPQEVLDLPRGIALAGGERAGALNIHASLLPRWRGAAPIVRAIEAGDPQTGVTLMQMDAGLDTGPMLEIQTVPILAQTTGGALTHQLADLGAHMIVELLQRSAAGLPVAAQPQPVEGVTYARKIDKTESSLNWDLPATVLANRIRAFDPVPGASSTLDDKVCKIWAARPGSPIDLSRHPLEGAVPGTVLAVTADGVLVACHAGPQGAIDAIWLTELQRAGGKRLSARDFLAGQPLARGARWGHIHVN